MSAQRILVTGGAGFIGSHLARRLVSAGYETHVLHRPHSDLSRIADLISSVQCWACDLTDDSAMAAMLDTVQPTIIYHLAGDTSVRHIDPSLAGVAASIERNVRAPINLVVAAQSHCRDLKILIRVGGLEEYGRGSVPYVESQREQPVSPYSASQVAVTHYLQMLVPYLRFRAITVRPALIYGPDQSTQFFIPALIDHCLKGQDFSMSSGNQGRDLLYIDDLIDALLLLLDRPLASGEIVNIGTGHEYIMSEVAANIIRLMGSDIQLRKSAPTRPSEIEHLYCSAEKAVTLLGWRPTIDLETGLSRMIAWFRTRHPTAPLGSTLVF